jgi:hypothetical protein
MEEKELEQRFKNQLKYLTMALKIEEDRDFVLQEISKFMCLSKEDLDRELREYCFTTTIGRLIFKARDKSKELWSKMCDVLDEKKSKGNLRMIK